MGNVNVISREDAHQTNMNTVPHNTVVGTAREPITIFVVRTRLKTAMHTLLKRKFKFGVRDRDGNTALHYAAEIGDMIVPLAPLSNLSIQNSLGYTPLAIAVMNQHYDAVAFLKEAMYVKDLNGNGPIHYAIQLQDVDMVKCLVKHSPKLRFSVYEAEEFHVNCFCNEENKSPLRMAVDNMDEAMVKCLLDLGAEATDSVKEALVEKGKTDDTILMYGTLFEDTNVHRNSKASSDSRTGLLSGRSDQDKYFLF